MLRDGRVVIEATTLAATGAVVRADHPWSDAQLARLYDGFSFEGDLAFYHELAVAEGGRVLEVACGTGRVLVPLARAGVSVAGIDGSPHMLAIARDKLRQAGLEAPLVEADMRDFDVRHLGPFDLATVAVKSFAYLTEVEDQLRCLGCIAAHLRPNGLLALDLLHPRPDWLRAPAGSMRDDLLERSATLGITLSRVESVVSTDLARQVRVIRSAYELIDDRGALINKRFVEWQYRYMFRFEAEHLLQRAGFGVEAVYGGYRREPFTSESATMLLLARKR